MKIKNKAQARRRRHFRIRRKVAGTADIPRMAVYLSNKHVYVQFIDDENGRTLAQVSTLEKELGLTGPNRETVQHVGKLAGERAQARGIRSVVFDRGGFAYGARLQTLANAARESGLKF